MTANLNELKESFEQSFDDILKILKAMGNEKRLRVLTVLLEGEKTFDKLMKETELKKTALSNHLTSLIKSNLIKRQEIGKYKITNDGIDFIKAIELTYNQSYSQKIKQLKKMETRQFSDMFLRSFLGKE